MSITVNKTSGVLQATIRDGAVDDSTSLTLLGKNYSGYGEKIAENFLWLLENFANNTPPNGPIQGQLWYKSSTGTLYVYDGSYWQPLANLTVASTAPTSASDSNIALGDMWWDSVNLQLKVYNGGATWITVGPSTAAGLGTSGQLTVSVNDNTGNPPPTNAHSIIKEWLDGTLIAIYSKDAEFTPSPAIAGFTTIKPGINFSTAGNILKVYGTATNADTLDSLDSTDFLRANVSALTSATISILNDTGIFIGTDSDLTLSLPGGLNAQVENTNVNGNISIITSGTGQVLTASSYTPTSNYSLTTKTYVDTQILSANATVSATSLYRNGANTITGNLLPSVTDSVTLGNSSYKFNNIFATTFTGNLSSTTVSSTSGVFSGNVTAGNITVADNITVTSLLDVKSSCRVATTTNITLSGTQTIDGISLIAGDRILVKDQTDQAQNGIYAVNASAWARVTDADASSEVTLGMFTFVEQGTINADTGWRLTTTGTINLGTTLLTFSQFNGAGSGNAIFALTVNGASSIRNIVPQATNAYNIGSASNTFANVYATAGVVGSLYTDNLRYANGAAYTFNNTNATNAVNAINLLVDGTYRTAVTTATSNTVVARDNSADIYASNFRASADMYATVFHGTATTSTYADLAENYVSDDDYEVGTVVMVGGERDITAAQPGVRALGVISENPAYLMNSHEIGQPVALKGKVPVKVTGIVKKGERLISGENGVAIAVSSSHADTFAISLETSDDTEIKLIQATII